MIKIALSAVLVSLIFPSLSWARKPPSLRLQIDEPYFSPNKDQSKDLLTFRIESEGLKKVSNWEFRIEDSGGVTKRTVTGADKTPATLAWDGLDDFGVVCAEGNYQISLTVWDSKLGVVSADAVTARVDLTPPIVSLTQDKNSPAGFLASAVDLAGIDTWKLEIQDSKGKLLDFSASSGSVPSSISWTPKENAELPSQGAAILSVIDKAGNLGQSPPVDLTFPKTPAPPLRESKAGSRPKGADTPQAPLKEKPAPSRKYLQMTAILSISDLFGPNADRDSDLRREAAAALAPLTQVLAENPGARAVILGHVDSQARRQDAYPLSSHFAWRTYSFFVKQNGVDKKSVAVKGLGHDVPLAREDTAVGRSRNRRIEIQIFIPENNEFPQ